LAQNGNVTKDGYYLWIWIEIVVSLSRYANKSLSSLGEIKGKHKIPKLGKSATQDTTR
jgi:hypothetical protein